MSKNIDSKTVEGFGEEWARFDQAPVGKDEASFIFNEYFHIFPWERLPRGAVGFDLGCGTGRWAARVAPRVGRLHCIDASEKALAVARRNLAPYPNCVLHLASVDNIPLPDGAMDFGYSLGVLHHVPDTAAGLQACAAKLKRGAPFLVYLYYAFDNRPAWFRGIWRLSDLLRRGIARCPVRAKHFLCDAIALAAYLPLARAARVWEWCGGEVANFPLSAYRRLSFYSMRTDALDRFGTRLEQRFTAREIRAMMEDAGFEDVSFSDGVPYWCAIGYKK
jgi:ubiquinone/menaquinone biosynthesis C-methylase UbiE